METSVHFVIARFNEDISWTNDIPANNRVIVYNKGHSSNENGTKDLLLENVGREAHTYVYHIVHNYDNLADYTVFLQGNPFAHMCIVGREQLAGALADYKYTKTEPFFNSNKHHEYTGLVKTAFNSLYGYTLESEVYFTDGAQWIAKKSDILNHPRSFYQDILDRLKVPNGSNLGGPGMVNAWTLEGLWQYIWNPDYVLRT